MLCAIKWRGSLFTKLSIIQEAVTAICEATLGTRWPGDIEQPIGADKRSLPKMDVESTVIFPDQ